jgi:hypothetical protein
VLEGARERHFAAGKFWDESMDVFMVRGENVVLIAGLVRAGEGRRGEGRGGGERVGVNGAGVRDFDPIRSLGRRTRRRRRA